MAMCFFRTPTRAEKITLFKLLIFTLTFFNIAGDNTCNGVCFLEHQQGRKNNKCQLETGKL
jgi:hypothetical protein